MIEGLHSYKHGLVVVDVEGVVLDEVGEVEEELVVDVDVVVGVVVVVAVVVVVLGDAVVEVKVVVTEDKVKKATLQSWWKSSCIRICRGGHRAGGSAGTCSVGSRASCS